MWRSAETRWTWRALALAAASLVLVSTLFSGRFYLFCLMMERPVEACCCAGEPSDESAPELRNGCCESRGTGEQLKGHMAAAAFDVPPATLGAFVEEPPAVRVVPRIVPARVTLPAPRRDNPIRAGPRHAAQACIELQVFRC